MSDFFIKAVVSLYKKIGQASEQRKRGRVNGFANRIKCIFLEFVDSFGVLILILSETN